MSFTLGFEKVAIAAVAGAVANAGGKVIRTLKKGLPSKGLAGADRRLSTVSGTNRGTIATYNYANSLKDNAQAARFNRRLAKSQARQVGNPAPSPAVKPQAPATPALPVQAKPAVNAQAAPKPQAAPKSKPNKSRKGAGNAGTGAGGWSSGSLVPAAAGAAGGYMLGSSNAN